MEPRHKIVLDTLDNIQAQLNVPFSFIGTFANGFSFAAVVNPITKGVNFQVNIESPEQKSFHYDFDNSLDLMKMLARVSIAVIK